MPPHIARELPGEFVMVMMHTTITRQGVLSLWPIRLPVADGGSMSGIDRQRTRPSTLQTLDARQGE